MKKGREDPLAFCKAVATVAETSELSVTSEAISPFMLPV